MFPHWLYVLQHMACDFNQCKNCYMYSAQHSSHYKVQLAQSSHYKNTKIIYSPITACWIPPTPQTAATCYLAVRCCHEWMENPSTGMETGSSANNGMSVWQSGCWRGCRFLLALLWDTALLRAAFQQLVLGEADVKAGVVHGVRCRRPCGSGSELGVRDQLLLGALAAAGGRQERPTLPEWVVVVVFVVVPQRRQQRLGLRANARVLAGRAGAAVAAAVAIAERVKVSGWQWARRYVREGEAAAAAAAAAVGGDLACPEQSRDLWPWGEGAASTLAVQGGRRRVDFGDGVFVPVEGKRKELVGFVFFRSSAQRKIKGQNIWGHFHWKCKWKHDSSTITVTGRNKT